MKGILAFFFFIWVKTISAQPGFDKQFLSAHLTTLDGKTFSMNDIKKNTASVFIFLLPDCPACQSYSLTLNLFSEKYKSAGISFYGVFPGDYQTAAEMKEFQGRYHIKFMLLNDPSKGLVKSLTAKVAPEAFVINNAGQTIYRGRIDDWMYAVGKKKQVITTHELKDALDAVVNHQQIKVSETIPVGCIIE